jgi:hypothetical protein
MDNNKIISISSATFIAEIITLPICTIKTVYQNNVNITTKQTIQKIYSENKLKGFFIASKPAIISQIISTTSKYIFYKKIKDIRNTKNDDLLNNALNGALGGILGSLITHPFDVWKNYTQRNENYWKFLTNKNINFKNFITKKIYPGYLANIYKNILLYSFLFPLNDYYKNKFNFIYISAPLTTLTISLIIQPIDYYKTVKMAGNNTSNFFRGLHLMIARSIPHFLITMTLTDIFYDKLSTKA